MNIRPITSLDFYQRKRDTILYRGMASQDPVFVKCILSPDPALRQALFDEFHVMHTLSHPGIPAYYGIMEDFPLPDREGHALALCMRDCLKVPQLHLAELSWPKVTEVLLKLCDILSYLLDHGVLYTDLNPTNILLHNKKTSSAKGYNMDIRDNSDNEYISNSKGNQNDYNIQVSLVDYTCCYFFLENPYPAYSLRFSYNLSPKLKGQQLLIQEMSFLLQELIDQRTESSDFVPSDIPSGIYRLLEAGKNPPDYLSLSEYMDMIEETVPFTGDNSSLYR